MNSNPCPDTVTPLLPWPGWIRRNQLELSELLRMFEATFASSPPWPITGISVGTLLRLSRLGSPSREAWSSGRRSGSPAPAPTPAPAELSTSAVETPRSPPLYSTRGLKCRALRKPRLSLPLDSVAIAEAQIPPVVPTGASRLSWRSPWDSAGMAEAETPEHSKMPALEPVLPAWAVSLFSTCFHPDPLEFEPQVASVQVDLAKTLESLQLEEKFGESYLYFRKLMQSALGADNEMLLQTKDISHFLMKDIAFLSGGRSKDNAWIITFPENCDFRCISEEKITKVLTYLTCIARKNGSDSRFIVILDRRSDTWSSTKISLQKISVSFPGNLHLVLVLRPTSFLQRTFTDIGLWFSHEDFMLKLPVVMLSSVSDLLTYIDAKQLTPELGGTLQYCHSEWILFTNAIEKFARSVKDVAYMLKSFGTELAETELPYDIPTIEDILLSRAARYRLLKNDITAITKEGTILLSNLRFPDTAVSASSAIERRQEISGDWQSINKLLTQVHDMETAFDGFWMKHKEKMDQYVQLWKFEQDFQEFTTEIQMSVNNLSEVADATGNISEVKQKLKIMDNIEESSKDLLSKARFLVLHGHKLAANHHFALDFIYQRSNEVRHLTDVMLKEMKTKRIQLNRTFKMHKLLQQAWQCCDEGESLLINGGKDRFQSEEDVQRALQDIENFLTVALPFIQYEGESLQREFDVVLSPELKMQMQAVQVKLENIRVIFERQQNMTGALTDKCGKPTQLQGSETEPLIQSITPSFSPKYAGIGYSFFQACKLFSKGKKTYRPTQSNVKVEGIPQIEKKDSVSQSCTLATDNNLDILKNHVLNELIQTETLYVQELFSVLSGYRAEMENPDMFHFIPTPLRDKKDILFGNMPEIYEFHKNIFISSLENCRRFPELVGQCFLERKNDFLQMYAKYCQNKPRSEQLWKNYSECAFFQICQRKLKHRLSLDSYLLKPVQRITKYQLLLKELLKYTFDIRGSEPLRQALDTILELLKSVNDSMHQVAITGFMGNLSDLGKMILQGPFNVWLGHRRGSTKMKDFARFKPMQRHLFLYEKAIVFCKRRESGERSERYPSYTFKRYLQMENVGITEFVKGDARKFEICSGEKEEVYTLQPPNLEMKTIWLKEIQTILAKQQELLTVTVQKEETQVPNQDPFASQQKSNIEQQGDFKSTGAARAGTPVNDSQATVQAEAEASSAVCTDMPQSSETPEGSQEWSAEHDLEDMPLLLFS